jgi:hypothetical protein
MSRRFETLGAMLLCILFPLQTTLAADAAMLKLVPPQTLSGMAGEGLGFSVVLLAQGQFSGPTYFDLPELDGAIIMQDSERPVLDTQQVGGETYVSASHDFTVYPQRAGRLVVAPITVRFSSRESYDQPAIEHRLQTEAFDLEVTAPPGAVAGEVIVSTRSLSATETWSPRPESAKVGDAFTRTISVRARDVPAMLLPPPDFQEAEGFAIYTRPPQIRDKSERGTLSAERTDTVTYVSERAGSYQIPELSLRWWDPDKSQWQTKSFPAVTLDVERNPALAARPVSGRGVVRSSAIMNSLLLGIVAVAAIAVVLLFRALHLKQRWQAWRSRRAASEPAQWKRLRKACDRGDVAEVYAELGRWLAYFGMSTPRLTVGSVAGVSERLREAGLGLQQRLAGIDAQWDARILAEELAALRRYLQMSGDAGSTSPLPPLNPTRPAMSQVRQVSIN